MSMRPASWVIGDHAAAGAALFDDF